MSFLIAIITLATLGAMIVSLVFSDRETHMGPKDGVQPKQFHPDEASFQEDRI